MPVTKLNNKQAEAGSEMVLQLGNLPNMVSVELRICQILAAKAFNQVSHTVISPGLFMILSLIEKNPGQKQSTLAQSVKLDRSTMVPIINHCEGKGWLERKPFAGDRRAHAIHLTKKGEQLVGRLEEDAQQLEQSIADGMSRKDRDSLLLLLKKLQAALPV